MKFIQTLSESHLLSSRTSYKKYSAKQIAELVYLHIIGLRILAAEPLTHDWAHDYAMRTARYLGFAQWYQNATDLHLLLHALVSEDVELKMPEISTEFKETLYFDEAQIKRWLKEISQGRTSESHTRTLFMALDGQFRIKDGSMKAIRRLAQDWPRNTAHQKKIAATRLLQIMRVRCSQSDIHLQLEHLSRTMDYEIKNVANQETGDNVVHDGSDPEHVAKTKRKGTTALGHMAAFAGGMLGYTTIKSLLGEEALEEDAAAGATVAADVATTVAPLGATQRRVPRKKKPKYTK